jgi:hypothetical protein
MSEDKKKLTDPTGPDPTGPVKHGPGHFSLLESYPIDPLFPDVAQVNVGELLPGFVSVSGRKGELRWTELCFVDPNDKDCEFARIEGLGIFGKEGYIQEFIPLANVKSITFLPPPPPLEDPFDTGKNTGKHTDTNDLSGLVRFRQYKEKDTKGEPHE